MNTIRKAYLHLPAACTGKVSHIEKTGYNIETSSHRDNFQAGMIHQFYKVRCTFPIKVNPVKLPPFPFTAIELIFSAVNQHSAIFRNHYFFSLILHGAFPFYCINQQTFGISFPLCKILTPTIKVTQHRHIKWQSFYNGTICDGNHVTIFIFFRAIMKQHDISPF